MSAAELLSVGVLSYNASDRLQVGLASLRQYLPGCPVMVWDNCSSDDSATVVSTLFPEVELVNSAVNLLFPEGCNQLVCRCDSRYLLLMNADVFLEDDSILGLVDFMEEHADLLATSPAVRDGGRTRHMAHDVVTPMLTVARDSVLGKVFRRTRWYRQAMHEQSAPNQVFFVPKITNSCCVLRCQAFVDLGGFHPGQFLYWTEEDIALRAAAAGYRQAVVGSSVVGHQHGTSTSTLPRSVLRAMIVHDRVAYMRRNFGALAAALVELAVALRPKIWHSAYNYACYLRHAGQLRRTSGTIREYVDQRRRSNST